jgi:hypothetical protein
VDGVLDIRPYIFLGDGEVVEAGSISLGILDELINPGNDVI